jgi:serine/threonine protein kinase
MTLLRGSLLHNRYRILEILGQGGMGSIYKAIDENLGLEVAVKDNSFTTEEYARQFRREAVILANLRHPNLPRVSDHFVIDGQGQYLVMDYIEGEDLRERMDRLGEIPESEILVISTTLCDALTYMHSRKPPVLHRDLKPGNVKITPQGEIFLVDFGLAKISTDGQQTSTGARAMTPGYSPPEQYGAARTDNRSDIYSLGATMYAALVGTIPEDSLARTMEQTVLTPIRKRNKNISRRTASAIEKALNVLPDDRFQNAEELKQALVLAGNITHTDVLDISTISTKPNGNVENSQTRLQNFLPEDIESHLEGPPFQIPLIENLIDHEEKPVKSRKISGRRWVFLSTLLIIVLLALGSGIAYIIEPSLFNKLSERDSTQTSLGGEIEAHLLASKTPDHGVSGTQSNLGIFTQTLEMADALDTTMPDPSRKTSTPIPNENSESRPTELITATPSRTVNPTATVLGGGSGQIAFSSDRTGLPQIWVKNIDDTGLRQVTNTQWGACQPDWSPDGMQIVFISPCDGDFETYRGSGLFIIDADGTDVYSLPIQGLGDYDPSWSPDGNKIVFTSLNRSDRPRILVLDLLGNETQILSQEDFRDLQPSWTSDGANIVFVSTRNGPYQLWVMRADGSEQIRFSVSGSKKDTYPVLSPNGKLIVFNQSDGVGSVPYLWGAPFPDRAEEEFALFTPGILPMKDADFSYDGHWIALESWPDGDEHDIYIMAVSGAELTRITFDPALDFDPAWRPIQR